MHARRTALTTLRVIVMFSTAVLTTAARAEEMKWLTSAEKAASEAEKTGKPILIYVSKNNCFYCDKMQQDVWCHPTATRRILRDFIPLKLSLERNPAAVRALKVKGYPTTVLFSSKRSFLGSLPGYKQPTEYLTALDQARTGKLLKQASAESPMRR